MSTALVSAGRLSPRQQKILAFIRRFIAERGYPPTIREIGRGCGISSTSVVDYNLTVLERLGFLRRDREVSRGIELTEPVGRATTVAVPIVGRIAAGEPIEALPGHPETITLEADLAGEGAYALLVKGTSMIEDLIDDGDLVIVRPQETAENGDIVVALLYDSPTGQGRATLKRFYREAGHIRLQPANSSMAPIYVRPEEVRIQGRVVAVIRRLL